jgi:hypothetical protein
MKKIIAIAFLLTLVAAPAFAAGEYSSASNPVVPNGLAGAGDTISVLSKNVTANVVSSATRFAATTAHTSGSKQYGTTSESTSIYSSDFEDGVTALVAPTVSDTTSFDGWTEL